MSQAQSPAHCTAKQGLLGLGIVFYMLALALSPYFFCAALLCQALAFRHARPRAALFFALAAGGFFILLSGYQIGKQLALRDNALCQASASCDR